MKKYWFSLVVALCATVFMLYQNGAFAEKPKDAPKPEAKAEQKAEAKQEEKKADESGAPTIQIDKTSLDNGGKISVTGTAPIGKPVYLEVWADEKVRASRFDSEVDKDTGKRPYILYMTDEMPAYYKIFAPKEQKENYEKNNCSKWRKQRYRLCHSGALFGRGL